MHIVTAAQAMTAAARRHFIGVVTRHSGLKPSAFEVSDFRYGGAVELERTIVSRFERRRETRCDLEFWLQKKHDEKVKTDGNKSREQQNDRSDCGTFHGIQTNQYKGHYLLISFRAQQSSPPPLRRSQLLHHCTRFKKVYCFLALLRL
jgi:DNA-binding LytR/AlgR family response regulator